MFLSKITTGLVAFTFVSLLNLPLAVLADYASPGACSGNCYAHDPSLIRRSSDGTYFRFNTGGGVQIYKADSLDGEWTYEGDALPGGSTIDLAGNTDLWAPDVHLIGDTYVMYYAISTFGTPNSAIGYATSSTLEYGSWTDHGSTGISSSSSKVYNAIDPNVIQTAEGSYYMNFGSFFGDIYQVEMNSGATKTSGASYNIAYNATSDHAEEGSFVYYRAANKYYYLFFSAGACCGYDTDMPAQGEEYSIRACRSTAVDGPYVDADGTACTANGGTTVLASHGTVFGPGGQGVYPDPEHGTVLYYHYGE